MKTFYKIAAISLFILLPVALISQTKGNGSLIMKDFDIQHFNQISVSGAFDVLLRQADVYYVKVETDENLFPNIDVRVTEGKLYLGSHEIRKYTKMKAYIGMPELIAIDASGATSVYSEDTLNGESLLLSISGASKANLLLNYSTIETGLSGASKLEMEGRANVHLAKVSGASKLDASGILTDSTICYASGAAKAVIRSQDYLETHTSGAAEVRLENTPAVWFSNGSQMRGTANDMPLQPGRHTDTTRINIGQLNVEVIDGDNVTINVAGRKISVDEDGNVDIKKRGKEKKRKFNGHWAGIELGFNGLLTPDFTFNPPKEHPYLDMRMEKSINLNLNFYEQNIPLNKSRNIGLVSGFGFSWNNYRFGNNVYITPDSSRLKGYYLEGVSVRKSKLTNLYLTVPLLFEIQSKGTKSSAKLHFAAGVIGGWRIRTHSKIYYNEPNTEFRLRDAQTNALLPGTFITPNSRNRTIVKKFDSFHMAPLKLDATVRAGWGIVNVYANYSVTSLFIAEKGPELYPFSIGLVLTGW
jgi:hypothetical protein